MEVTEKEKATAQTPHPSTLIKNSESPILIIAVIRATFTGVFVSFKA